MAASSTHLSGSITPISAPHMHAAQEYCPTCDQAVSGDRVAEIKDRLREREEAHEGAVTARLTALFAQEKDLAIEAATLEGAAALKREREQNAVQITAAQELARSDIERARQEAETASSERIAGMQHAHEAEKSASDARFTALQAQLTSAREEAAANETRVRTEERQMAAAAVSEQIANFQRERQSAEATFLTRIADSDAAKAAAHEAATAAQARLEQAQSEQAEREARAREEGIATASAAFQTELQQANLDKATAETSAAASQADRQTLTDQLAAARGALETQQASQDAAIAQAIQQTREALEITTTATIGALKAESHNDKQKVLDQLADVQRKLEKKTADELGEGAEVNLLEDLKAGFPQDKFKHVGKGNPGADIIHTVIHNGMECGKIIYDSKDHGQWRDHFATKLASDKIAEKAEQAILSIRAFPRDAKQLGAREGIILANPARVVALVQIVREHIVKSHALRLSNEQKAQKSAELYTFITSPQCTDLLNRIDTHAQELLDMRVREQKAHEKNWKEQDILYRSIQKTGADLTYRIDVILGTAADKAVNEQ
jgi:hypothetical protein